MDSNTILAAVLITIAAIISLVVIVVLIFNYHSNLEKLDLAEKHYDRLIKYYENQRDSKGDDK